MKIRLRIENKEDRKTVLTILGENWYEVSIGSKKQSGSKTLGYVELEDKRKDLCVDAEGKDE